MLTKTLRAASANQSQFQTSLFVNGAASKNLMNTQKKAICTTSVRSANPAMKIRPQTSATLQAVAEPPVNLAEPGAPGTMPVPGILDNLFPP